MITVNQKDNSHNRFSSNLSQERIFVTVLPNSPTSHSFPGLSLNQLANQPETIGVRVKVPFNVTLNFSPTSPISASTFPFGSNTTSISQPTSSLTAALDSFNHLGLDSCAIENQSSTIEKNKNNIIESSYNQVKTEDIWNPSYVGSGDASWPTGPKQFNEPPFNRNYLSSLNDEVYHNKKNMSSAGISIKSPDSNFSLPLHNPAKSLKEGQMYSDQRINSYNSTPGFLNAGSLQESQFGSLQSNPFFDKNEYRSDFPLYNSPADYYRAGFARRMSLTPKFGSYTTCDELSSCMETLTLEEYNHILNRRHSAAAVSVINASIKAFNIDAEFVHPEIHEEDSDEQTEQFDLELFPDSNTSSCSSQPDTYFVVQFKVSRTDAFYLAPDCPSDIKIGNHVIVQGDRGKDLGIVIRKGVTLEAYKKEFGHFAVGPDGSQSTKEIEPKMIYRNAFPQEIAVLASKAEDEEKALALVHSKTAQQHVYMKIVYAEYQWDRRKLTFYFVSDRRIDFRDLVRELFKIYKTRIWMCAVTR